MSGNSLNFFVRPHQARETLKVMMKMQQKNLTEAGEKLSKNVDKASEILKQCSDEINTLMSKVFCCCLICLY